MPNAVERLRVAHHLALRAQHTSHFDAGEIVRAWPNVAYAALRAQNTLGIPATRLDHLPHRVALTAESVARLSDGQWPGSGPVDLALQQVSAALESAADSELTPILPADSERAAWLITSALWTTSQLAARATRDFSSDLEAGRQRSAFLGAALLSSELHYRFNAVEHLASGVLNSQPREPTTGLGADLRLAVATWDIEAHRALLSNQSTAVLHVLSHLQAESVKAVEAFVDQAKDHGVIDGVTSRRLTPLLRDSSASWEKLRDTTAPLLFAETAVPMSFIDSARNLQEAFGSAARASQSEHHPAILRATSSHLSSSVAISATAHDLIATGELRAPARAMARMLSDTPSSYDDLSAQVDPIAVFKGSSLPLHTDVRRRLLEPARQTLTDAHEAVERSSGLDGVHAHRTPVEPSDPKSGRAMEDRYPEMSSLGRRPSVSR